MLREKLSKYFIYKKVQAMSIFFSNFEKIILHWIYSWTLIEVQYTLCEQSGAKKTVWNYISILLFDFE